MPLNLRILRAWPNYLIIPIMVVIWIVVGVLGTELLGAPPFNKGTK